LGQRDSTSLRYTYDIIIEHLILAFDAFVQYSHHSEIQVARPKVYEEVGCHLAKSCFVGA